MIGLNPFMPLVPLLPLFYKFNREYFNNSLTIASKPLVALRWSDGRLKKTAGFYRRKVSVFGITDPEIVLSKPVLQHLPVTAIESTLCHEMIHSWIDLVLKVSEVHGPIFHEQMALINSAQSRFKISVSHKFPVPTSIPKWVAVCPSCGLRFSYKRIVNGVACRSCCNLHSAGRWHEKFLLIYETAAKEN